MQANILFPINTEGFTYLVPEKLEIKVKIGSRVLAPFKRGKKVGIVVGINENTDMLVGAGLAPARIDTNKRATVKVAPTKNGKEITLKSIESVLDEEPLIPDNLLKLIQWVGQYYMSTSGLALKNAVPSGIFEDKKSGRGRITYDDAIKPVNIFKLTYEQEKALSEINKAQSGAFLLHGVTGSGKTEIYIRAIEALGGREAIVLVPEIALTTQIVDRFRSRFQEKVAFFHSGLSPGERISQWRKIRNSEVKVAIGVRSAVFAPFKNPGLIIIDEEHETSYKQFEGLKYSARDVALARAKIEGIKIILGSATPSVESFYHAKKGKLTYLELTQRIEQKPMPRVEIIDMTREDKESFSYSKKLLNVLKENLSEGHQSLIMLNRRGYSPFLMCMDCGYTYKCPACSITLTYHKDTKTLNCHYCNSFLKPQDDCPQCKGIKIKYIGLGTQRVEEDLNALIPELSLKRMDRDTTRKKLSHYRIVKDMEEKKIDVLLGTQMIAKGHDFPDVTVAAVVFADVALNLPDFRSSERTFQLFTQLAGRAGRGDVSGAVYIQTYEPEYYVFDYVRNQDYTGFYQKEIELRKELSYPPFSKLIRVVLSFRNKEDGVKIMKSVSARIKKITWHQNSKLKTQNSKFDFEILGPSPASIEKIRNYWRWHLILKGKNSKSLRQKAAEIIETLKDIKDIKIDVDVDPINLL
ncbi:MAG: primosomal protein N' [Nitrospirae bacterium]|nr:primosomal protein N' [Nitrospirota bacterium]